MKFLSLMVVVTLCGIARTEPPDELEIDIQVLRLDEGLPENLFLKSDGDWMAVKAARETFQHPAAYRGPNPLRLYQSVIEAGELHHETVAGVLLPVVQGEVLLFLSSGDEGVELSAVVLDQSIPAGSFIFLNRTKQPIQLTLGETSLTLTAGEQAAQHPSEKERGLIPFTWRVTDSPATPKSPAAEGAWFYNPDRWYLVFFEQTDDRISVRSVTRFPPR